MKKLFACGALFVALASAVPASASTRYDCQLKRWNCDDAGCGLFNEEDAVTLILSNEGPNHRVVVTDESGTVRTGFAGVVSGENEDWQFDVPYPMDDGGRRTNYFNFYPATGNVSEDVRLQTLDEIRDHATGGGFKFAVQYRGHCSPNN